MNTLLQSVWLWLWLGLFIELPGHWSICKKYRGAYYYGTSYCSVHATWDTPFLKQFRTYFLHGLKIVLKNEVALLIYFSSDTFFTSFLSKPCVWVNHLKGCCYVSTLLWSKNSWRDPRTFFCRTGYIPNQSYCHYCQATQFWSPRYSHYVDYPIQLIPFSGTKTLFCKCSLYNYAGDRQF